MACETLLDRTSTAIGAIRKAFGPPGDYGYSTPQGEALNSLYNINNEIVTSTETAQWMARPTGGSFYLEIGKLKLAATDQSDRDCGWCWHVSIEHDYGGDQVACGPGCKSADEAKAKAIQWVRDFCETTLAVIAAKGCAA